jgi:hypothetical protein
MKKLHLWYLLLLTDAARLGIAVQERPIELVTMDDLAYLHRQVYGASA